MDRLALPGRPGLIIPCSPVWHPQYVGDGVCVGVGSKYADVAFTSIEARKTVPLSELFLRLDVATGRAHAAWRLAGASNAMCRFYRRSRGRDVKIEHMSTVLKVVWTADGRHCAKTWKAWDVPGLADLDPNDPRTLPDGSRWVDAEALRLVYLYVAEGTS